jgi:hypothetical protein
LTRVRNSVWRKNRTNIPARALIIIFSLFQIQILRIYNQTKQIVTVPHPRPDCTTSKGRSEILPSPLVKNKGMNGGNDKNLLLLAAATIKGSRIDEDCFKQYLLAQKKRNWKQILLKATKHGHILQTRDASEILTFSNTKRRHVMEALVYLSRYQGTYNTWKEIKEKYQLKWTSPDTLVVFQSIYNDEKNYSAMLNWLNSSIARIPKPYANILIYTTLTGLRPTEACQSTALIQGALQNYLKTD